MRRSKGFTLVELLVVIAIIGLLMMMLMPSLGRARELAKRTMCGTNLKTLGTNIAMYRAEYEDKFPLMQEYGDSDADITKANDTDDLWEGAPDALTLGPNAMQNVWLLIYKQGVSEQAFQCASDGDYKQRVAPTASDKLLKYGWITEKNYSYQMHKPYPMTAAGTDNNAPLTEDRKGSFPIFADKLAVKTGDINRVYWESTTKSKKPSNHPEDGFNYLTFGGSVSFHKTEVDEDTANSEAGIAKDDIYTAGHDADGNNIIPTSQQDASAEVTDDTDTFILPWSVANAASN